MEFLNIGAGELLVILFIALLVFGPERLPEIARQIGKAVRDFQRLSSEATDVIREAIQEMEEPVKESGQVLRDTQKELEEELRHIGEAMHTAAKAAEETVSTAAAGQKPAVPADNRALEATPAPSDSQPDGAKSDEPVAAEDERTQEKPQAPTAHDNR